MFLRHSSLRLTRSSLAYPQSIAAARTFSSTPITQFSKSLFKMGVTQITTKEEWKDLVTNSKEPFVVDFFATWCGPCKAIAPIVEKISETTPSVKFYKVDVDQLAEVAQENSISAMPTFVFFKDGKKDDDLTVRGANRRQIEENIEKLSA